MRFAGRQRREQLRGWNCLIGEDILDKQKQAPATGGLAPVVSGRILFMTAMRAAGLKGLGGSFPCIDKDFPVRNAFTAGLAAR